MKQKQKISVLIVDTSPLLRQALSDQLNVLDGIEVLGEAENYNRAVKLVHRLGPDAIILDADMENADDIGIKEFLAACNSRTRVILWSRYSDKNTVDEARRAGVSAWIPKDRNWDGITSIIQAVTHGNCFFWILQHSQKPKHVSCP